ncbi:MAG: DUF3619 family protein [Polaromonas sp.]|nr:DUF3619 family protein [Polaromonas sp.]
MNHFSIQKQLLARSDRFGLKIASYMSEGAQALPHDVSERLRAARAQAVSKRKIAANDSHVALANGVGSSTLILGSRLGFGWLSRVGLVFPLVALVIGVMAINSIQSERRAQELAEVDAALLTDDLPPAAFTDPGFVQCLKNDR